jgi:hypothetical protein
MSPVRLISSTKKDHKEKIWNFDHKPKKNLIKEIENALNCKSKKTNNLKAKIISLKNDKIPKEYQDNPNQENIDPNLIRQKNESVDGSNKQMKRIAFEIF